MIEMQLKIKGVDRTFSPIQRFREAWGLPDSFQVAAFEPKQWAGLGSLEGAQAVLLDIKQRVIEAVAAELSLPELLPAVAVLGRLFRYELEKANVRIGLREVEVDFAVSGFEDILRAAAYALIQLAYTHPHDPAQICLQFDYPAVYQTWLNDSVRLSGTTHLYEYEGLKLEVRVVYNAYGRVGLEVEMNGRQYYLADMSLACPAASYMRDLCGDTAQALCQALTGQSAR